MPPGCLFFTRALQLCGFELKFVAAADASDPANAPAAAAAAAPSLHLLSVPNESSMAFSKSPFGMPPVPGLAITLQKNV